MPSPPTDVDAASVWRVAGPDGLIWQAWDEDEVIVFHRASGRTHMLDALSAALLREIESGAGTAGELAMRLARTLDLPTERLADRVPHVCTILSRAQLIDPTN